MIGLPPKAQSHLEEALDLTAMVDVLFTLLVFLLLTMGTTQITTHLQLAQSSSRPQASPETAPNIPIELDRQTWNLSGVTYQEFSAFSRAFLAAHRDEYNRPVRILPQRDLPVEELVRVMNFLSEHQFSNLQIQSQWAP
ncbi:MAG: biopolymer transporter ExbD [bacterium]|nr:biopolymer transporter ExbD [bacterium]